ncbi:MAG TPA: hypothetical protein VN762_07595, partial [Steroidobacteraceae bacterium]|nr:hypothetical protein [Steroidobacteraceae bacterium]
AGYLLPELLRRRAVQWTLAAFASLVVVLCLAGWGYLTWVDPQRGAQLLQEGGIASFAPLLCLGALGVAALLLFQLKRAHLALLSVLVAGWQVFGWWISPAIDGARSARDFIAQLERMASPQRELGLLAYHEHFLWQLRRPSVNFGHRRFREGDAEMYDAAAWLAASPQRQLLVPERMLQPCFHATGDVRLVGESSRGDWYLVSGEPAADCARRGNAGYVFHYAP